VEEKENDDIDWVCGDQIKVECGMKFGRK